MRWCNYIIIKANNNGEVLILRDFAARQICVVSRDVVSKKVAVQLDDVTLCDQDG